MKYYLSGQADASFWQQVTVRRILVSLEASKTLANVITKQNSLLRAEDVMVDSGAFTVWNTGGTIDVNVRIQNYADIRQILPEAHLINLDVIPGERGRKATRQEALVACEAGWQNYLAFARAGIKVLPVFHQLDEWEYLDRMMETSDYICVSPTNRAPTEYRKAWLDAVYAKVGTSVKTHSLAGSGRQLLERYPFYSVDATNWLKPVQYGQSVLDGDLHTRSKPKGQSRVEILAREIKQYEQIERDITKLWERRGVVWKD